ncbi:hypothetical protein IPZ58_35325 [Streptomyces roseoverticillatus]|uniref:hypothetical protein n=1 Tax=Streptomyces roseoverticillatus TaxID=66429 RepID=UPI001F3986B5|nr:hypothetical protein [Streptomyces roseoverticillatus]MCF3106798.1 hypothetical protein [Streptomyces roseoverticillatus]
MRFEITYLHPGGHQLTHAADAAEIQALVTRVADDRVRVRVLPGTTAPALHHSHTGAASDDNALGETEPRHGR